MKSAAEVIPAKRKRKILTPSETKTVTYAEDTASKTTEQNLSPVAKRVEHDSKLQFVTWSISKRILSFIFPQFEQVTSS